MRKVTYYGYFGRPQNVRDSNIDVDAFAALIGALPRRRPTMVDPEGRPLRFIARADLPATDGAATSGAPFTEAGGPYDKG